MQPFLRPLAAVAAAAVACAVGVLVVAVIANRPPSCGSYRFDQDAWMAPDATAGTPSARQRQAEPLVRCKVLEGRTRATVVAMLGPGQEFAAGPGHPELSWLIGSADFLGGSGEYVSAQFGDDDRVWRVVGPPD